jgi:hypothetical protein
MRDTNTLLTLHHCSPLGILDDVNLFQLPLTQISHKASEYATFHPITHGQITAGQNLEFAIPPTHLYTDPSHIFLYCRGKIVKDDDVDNASGARTDGGSGSGTGGGSSSSSAGGSTSGGATGSTSGGTARARRETKPVPDAEKVTCIDAFAATMWSQVDVYLQDQKVSSNENYAYRVYYDLVMKTNYAMRKFMYWPALFDGNNSDTITYSTEGARFQRTRDGEFEMMHQVMTDLSFSQGLLLPHVGLRYLFRHNDDKMRLMTDAANNGKFRFVLTKATLLVKRVDIAPHVQLSHEKLLNSKRALYVLPGVETKLRPLSPGTKEVLIENIQSTRLPSALTFLFIKTAAHQGDIHRSPLRFENMGIRRAVLTIGTKQIRESFDFEKDHYVRGYMSMLRAVQNPELCLSHSDYKNNMFQLRYVLTPDCSLQHLQPLENENIRLELELDKALEESYTCIILLQTPKIVEIDKQRQVTVQ